MLGADAVKTRWFLYFTGRLVHPHAPHTSQFAGVVHGEGKILDAHEVVCAECRKHVAVEKAEWRRKAAIPPLVCRPAVWG